VIDGGASGSDDANVQALRVRVRPDANATKQKTIAINADTGSPLCDVIGVAARFVLDVAALAIVNLVALPAQTEYRARATRP
jgi:hypothetical protein